MSVRRVVAVAVRTPGDRPGERRQQIPKFKTFYQVLPQTVAWLTDQGVTHVTNGIDRGVLEAGLPCAERSR